MACTTALVSRTRPKRRLARSQLVPLRRFQEIGEVREVRSVELTLVGQPTDVRLYLTDEVPTGVAGLQPVASETVDGTSLTVEVEASGQYVVVWLVGLPAVDGGFRGQVGEVVVRAA